MTYTINMIWAQTFNGIIGRNGIMPWYVPEDLAHFQKVTSGHTVIMGRRTWDSLPEKYRPLKDRTNIVLTRQRDWAPEGTMIASSVERALSMVPGKESEVWIIGGATIYEAFMDRAESIVITDLDFYEGGDTEAPWLTSEWSLDSVSPADDKLLISTQGVGYRFRTMKRTKKAADTWLEDSPLWG